MSNLDKFINGFLSYYFIVEVADAHYGDLDRAKRMIERSIGVGAQAVKFQHHIPAEEMLREVPQSKNMKEPLYDFLVKNALKINQHIELANYCKQLQIDYLCTPFSWAAAQELEDAVSPIAYKIGSGELLDHPTILKIMSFNKPMVLSTGMSTESEIKSSYNLFLNFNKPLILMNCTSAYPPSFSELHLKFIARMIKEFPRAIIGHSDHTPGIESTLAAYTLGAKVFEKHLTDDEDLIGPDSEVSISFTNLKNLINGLDNLTLALNSDKQIHPSENEIRAWAHRSLVYLKSLNKGDVIQEGDIWGKRPGTGVPSRYIHNYMGKTLIKSVMADTLLSDSDFAK